GCGLFAFHLGRTRDLPPAQGKRLVAALQQLPDRIREILGDHEKIASVAARLVHAGNAFFIGRATGFPVAMEGAQKLKEISYIHAEAYPASELKHGPLALISPETPTVVVIPRDDLYEKTLSSIAEIKARRGPVIAVTQAGDEPPAGADDVLVVPSTEPALATILLTIPLQLLAYCCAVALERDVD